MLALPTRPTAVRFGRAALALLGALLATTCGGGDPASPSTTPPVSRPGIIPLDVAQANGLGPDTTDVVSWSDYRVSRREGNRQVAVAATWTVSDTAVISVRSVSDTSAAPTPTQFVGTEVRVRGHRRGTATLTVTFEGAVLTRTIQVILPRPAHLLIERETPVTERFSRGDSLIVGSQTRFRARCLNGVSRTTALPIKWEIDDTTRATVSPDGTIDARALGTATLSASCVGQEGGAAGSNFGFVVRPPRAVRLAFVRAPDSVRVRRPDSVRVAAYDASGAPVVIATALRVGSLPLSARGVFTAFVPGTLEMSAEADGLTITRPLRVYPAPLAPPVPIPAVLALVPGRSARLVGRLLDEDGFLPAVGGAQPIAYASDDPAIATVPAAGGHVVAGAIGSTRVRLRAGALASEAPVQVVAPGGFSIAVRPVSGTTIPPEIEQPLASAVALWESAIVGDLPDVRLTIPGFACDRVAEQTVTVDDVLVFVSVDSIDGAGGTLAMAGPCIVRGNLGGTVVGRVFVDRADLTPTNGIDVPRVLAHEIGHVLGIGTLWGMSARDLIRRNVDGYLYVGERGLRVARWWDRVSGGLDGGPAGVPLGGAGTAPDGGHWNEGSFGRELMTPRVGRGGPEANVLSLLTLEALADLGYLTSAAAAEPFGNYPIDTGVLFNRLPDAAFGSGGRSAGGTDRVLAPRFRWDGSRVTRIGR